MKKLLLLTAIAFFALQIANAQTEKGDQTLGFNLNYTYHNDNQTEINTFDTTSSVARTKTTNFGIGPTYSYFIADKLDLGVSLAYNTNVENDYPINGEFGEKETVNIFDASIFLRKYCMYNNKLGVRFGPYLSYSYSNDNDVSTDVNADPANNLDTKTHNFDAGLNLDVVYFATKKLGFAATIGNLDYNHYSSKDTPTGDHDKGDNLTLNFINSALSISMFFVFGSK